MRPAPGPALEYRQGIEQPSSQTHGGDPAGGLGRKLHAAFLILLMAAGSIAVWIAIPIGWLWIGSQIADSQQTSMGLYLLVMVGILVSVLAVAKGLGWLDRHYARVIGVPEGGPRLPLPWLRSMRGERGTGRRTSVLDIVMIGSVSIAGLAMAVWFLVFAGSPLPT